MSDQQQLHHAAVRDFVVAIFRANGAVIANGDRLVADLGLTSSLWQVLDALHRSRTRMSVADIARAMGLARQSVQRSADLLAERTLVAYEDNPAHRRAKLVRLTEAGQRALEAVHARETVSIDRVLARLAPTGIEAATRVLTEFADELAHQTRPGDDA